MPAKFPCKICNNPVAKNHKAVECDNCGLWVHIKCNKTNTQTYKYLQKEAVKLCMVLYFLLKQNISFSKLE